MPNNKLDKYVKANKDMLDKKLDKIKRFEKFNESMVQEGREVQKQKG